MDDVNKKAGRPVEGPARLRSLEAAEGNRRLVHGPA